MDNLNIPEILKVGLPGLVFLLSVLSFKLLNSEQQKKAPSQPMLRSIKQFMYINIFLAVLTASGPFVEKTYFTTLSKTNAIEDIPLTVTLVSNNKLGKDEAAYCAKAKYGGRFILISDGGKATQRFAKYGTLMCDGQDKIQINSPEKLGFKNDETVTVFIANEGMKFIVPAEETSL